MLWQWRHRLWRDGDDNDINIDGGDDNNNGGDSEGDSNGLVYAATTMTTATAEVSAAAKICDDSGRYIQQSTNSGSRKNVRNGNSSLTCYNIGNMGAIVLLERGGGDGGSGGVGGRCGRPHRSGHPPPARW